MRRPDHCPGINDASRTCTGGINLTRYFNFSRGEVLTYFPSVTPLEHPSTPLVSPIFFETAGSAAGA